MAKAKGRPKKPSGEGTPVRIDSDIASKAKYLAALQDRPLSDYLSGLLRPIVDREFRKAGKNLFESGEQP
jgi:hypothetical protein